EAGVYVVPSQYLQNNLFGWNEAFGGWTRADSVITGDEFKYVAETDRTKWSSAAFNEWVPPNVTEESARAYSQWRKDLLTALHKAGVKVLLGTGGREVFNVAGF